jgi:hypothetical protein
MFKSSNRLPVPKYQRNTCYTTTSGNTIKILLSEYVIKYLEKMRDEKGNFVKDENGHVKYEELQVRKATSKRESLPRILIQTYGIPPELYASQISILYTAEGFRPDGTKITHSTGPDGTLLPHNPYYNEALLTDMIDSTVAPTLCVRSPSYSVGDYRIPYDKYHPVFDKESFFRMNGISSTGSEFYPVGTDLPIRITKQYYVIQTPKGFFSKVTFTEIDAVDNHFRQPEVNAFFEKNYPNEPRDKFIYDIYYVVDIYGKTGIKLPGVYLNSCHIKKTTPEVPQLPYMKPNVAGGKSRTRRHKKSLKMKPRRKSMKN